MEQLNFHKQKLFAMIAAGVGFIAMFLPWWRFSFGGIISQNINGIRDLGILAFLGFIGAGVLTYLGDRTKPFEGQNKLIVAACFGGAALVSLIQYLRIPDFASYGLWLSLIAGVAGGVIVYVLKPEQLENKQVP